MRETKRAFPMWIAVGALLLGASGAWAIEPEQGEYSIFFDGYLGSCSDTLSLCEKVDGVVHSKLFFDENGDPKRYTERYQFAAGIYECGNPDNILESVPVNYSWSYDFTTQEDLFHGLFYLIVYPGYGPVFMDVGRIVVYFDLGEVLFEAGEHDWWYLELDRLCPVFLNAP